MPLTEQDLSDLHQAVALLEAPSLTMRIAGVVGKPIEWAIDALPKWGAEKIQRAVLGALSKSVSAALWTMDTAKGEAASNKTHLGLAAASGAVGGFFGLTGTLLELPVSTTIMMRSVADIARSQGFDVRDPLVQAECIQVFAMGGPTATDDAAESAYYGMRNAMVLAAQEVGVGLGELAAKQAAEVLAKQGTRGFSQVTRVGPKDTANVLVKLIEAVAQRFGIQVTEKIAAQAVPVIGAVSGASINSLFLNHFQDMARGHFMVLRLEKIHGRDEVAIQYKAIKQKIKAVSA